MWHSFFLILTAFLINRESNVNTISFSRLLMGLSDVAQWTTGMAVMLTLYPEKPASIMVSGESALSLGISLGKLVMLEI